MRSALLGLSVALTMCGHQAPVTIAPVAVTTPPVEVPTVVVRSPAGLAALLADYDRATGDRSAIALAIDRMAAQRDAVTSRMYWYTDLDLAKAEAQRTHRPILSLRLLGRLDEEMSCANSRLFRIVLYANAHVSQFLRDNYVLHWSSERPVPQITLDFGDGRVVHRTITGNSVHYVLDAQGRVVDAVPGLYGPAAFQRDLEESLELARTSGGLGDDESSSLVTKFHTRAIWRLTAQWRKLLERSYEGYEGQLKDASLPSPVKFSKWPDPLYGSIPATLVNQLTESKADTEAPSLQLLQPEVHAYADWGDWTKIAAKVPVDHLDDASRELVRAKQPRDWTTSDAAQLTPDKLAKRLTLFEARMSEEALRNEYVFHGEIHHRLSNAKTREFSAVNDWLYAQVFMTPKSDAWLGLRPTEAITGIANDGLRSEQEAQRLR